MIIFDSIYSKNSSVSASSEAIAEEAESLFGIAYRDQAEAANSGCFSSIINNSRTVSEGEWTQAVCAEGGDSGYRFRGSSD